MGATKQLPGQTLLNPESTVAYELRKLHMGSPFRISSLYEGTINMSHQLISQRQRPASFGRVRPGHGAFCQREIPLGLQGRIA